MRLHTRLHSRSIERVHVRAMTLAIVFAFWAVARPAAAQTVEAAVARAESSIACILVSRSDWYRRYLPKDPRASDAPGQLGGFDAATIANRLVRTDNEGDVQYAERVLSETLKLDLSDPRHTPETFGSGVVVDASGLVLTNYHVVQDASKVYVRLPGGHGSYANIWSADPRSDLAVLKLIVPSPRKLTPIEFGDADPVRRGQAVAALSNPFAIGMRDGQASVSAGVVSNVMRRVPGRRATSENNALPLYQYGILMQTDARIALGSSGGALVDLKGECIGILTSLAAIAGSDAPGGFALPVNAGLRKVIDVLKRGEEVEYGYLGVAVKDSPKPGTGAFVTDAQPGSPAQRAGLQSGDLIVAVGEHPVHDSHDLMLGLGLFLAGDKAPITIIRHPNKRQTVSATLVKYLVQGKTIASSLGNRPYVGGMRIDYTSLLAQRPNFAPSIPPGVLISDVRPGSKAAKLQLFTGDVVTHVAGTPVNSPAEFYDQLARHAEPIELTLRRDQAPQRVRW